MSVLFRDVEDESTIQVDCKKEAPNEINIVLIERGGFEESEASIYLDVHTAIQFRKALTLAIGKARNEKGGRYE